VSLIDRARGVSSEEIWRYPVRTLTMFKRFTYSDPTERSTGGATVYGTFTFTAPPDRSVWLLGVRFSRDMYASAAFCCSESWITRDDSGVSEGLAGTSSTTYVTLRTRFWIGSLVLPSESALFRIWFRNTAGYTAYMKNVIVNILYAEVEA
jgi:hypothetical protein